MSNFAEEIEKAAEGPILGIVLDLSPIYGDGEKWRALRPLEGKLLTWAEARPLLDREWDSGFGGQDCPNFFAWTETKVLSRIRWLDQHHLGAPQPHRHGGAVMAPRKIASPTAGIVPLGEGSGIVFEDGGGLTFYLDARNPQETDIPEWKVSHAMGPVEVSALRVLLASDALGLRQ